jgi:hypothetical protein
LGFGLVFGAVTTISGILLETLGEADAGLLSVSAVAFEIAPRPMTIASAETAASL